MEKRNATAAVIGAGDYIGAAIAKKFAAEGFIVFAGRRQGDKLAAAAGSYSVDGTFGSSRPWVAHMVTLKGNHHQSVTFGGEFQPSAVLFASAPVALPFRSRS